jgi:CheY-like chemotaxis protein
MPTLLIVDDDEVDRYILKAALREHWTEAVVVEAGSASDGFDLLRSTAPDLVLVDLYMPGRSGFELLEMIRATGAGGAKVVVLTGSLAEADFERARVLRVDLYARKPAEEAEYVRLIGALKALHQDACP